MARPLILGPALRPTCIVLELVPVPGVGAIIAGAKNPHSKLLGRGIAQASLVVFGSYPLIIPGAFGLAWAIWDAVAIARNSRTEPAWTHPTPDADPATLTPTRAERAAQRQSDKAVRRADSAAVRAERQAAKAAEAAERAEQKAAKLAHQDSPSRKE